jgi:hypothetical protein
VTVADGVVHIIDLVETDPAVVEALEGAEDAESGVRTLLRIGAQSVRLASVDLDTQAVERRFDTLAGTFDSTVTKAVSSIADVTGALLDEEHGSIPTVLGQLRQDLSKLLGDTFDPDSKSSVIATVETVLTRASEQMAGNIRATFSLDLPDSPLARTKKEMVDTVKEEVRTVLAQVHNLHETFTAAAAVAEVSDKLTSKGISFEDLIGAGLGPCATVHSDIVEAVGRSSGSAGTLKGDLLVTVCPDDTAGRPARFVFEAKDQKLSMTKTLAELDAALANHDASAAIAVFAGEHLAPMGVTFWYSGNRAILVYAKADPDRQALRLAYEWARWVCRRTLAREVGPALEVEAVHAAIDRARQALKRHQTIKACHSVIKNKADEAKAHVADLVAGVDQAIAELLDSIQGSEEAA